jgi:hypothetical protein
MGKVPFACIGVSFAFLVLGGAAAVAAKIPLAVTVARATAIPACNVHVDAGFSGTGTGSASKPFRIISAAIAAASNGAIICVAEGVYPERLAPGTKFFTLAGGFRSNSGFTERDSAKFVSKAQGSGGSFMRIVDPGPAGNQLTAIDGFEITGYSQAILREYFLSQRFDLTNNFIHDNLCSKSQLAGAGFSLNNVTGEIRGNVIKNNRCGRGGAGFLNDSANENEVSITRNRVEGNFGDEAFSNSHGGGLYLFTNTLTVRGNLFTGNRATGWGGGLYIGAFGVGQPTTAQISWNVYHGNRAGIMGGGFFCDDGASCTSSHDIHSGNCGGNIYLDSGGVPPTRASFDHLTNYGARSIDCASSGAGVTIDNVGSSSDSHSFTNAIFWGNALNKDFAASCSSGPCSSIRVKVSYSMVQTKYLNNGVAIAFGKGILQPTNPRFVDIDARTGEAFHLKSIFGHWTKSGYVKDSVSSPALAKGNPDSSSGENPPKAGERIELGAYGNSAQASYVK